MWAWLKSPRGSTATATAVAALLALFWFAPWSRPLPGLPGSSGPATPPDTALSAMQPPRTATTTTAAPAPAAPKGQEMASAPQGGQDGGKPQTGSTPPPPLAAAAPPPAGTPAGAQVPAFDVVRVEPSGATVIAGRGEPGSTVTLMDVGQAIAHVTVDPSGQFALLPPDLAEGSHYLTLQSGPTAEPAVSKQGVAVAVGKPGVSKPLVAMLSPDGPARVLSDGSPIGPLVGAPAAPTPLAIQAVEAASGGRFTASGVARPGSQSRLYLNGSFLADVTAGPDGRWAVKVEKGMRPGPYVVRADELEAGGSKVVHRAEVPFTYPALQAGDARKQILASRTPPTPTVMASNAPLRSQGPTPGQPSPNAPRPAMPDGTSSAGVPPSGGAGRPAGENPPGADRTTMASVGAPAPGDGTSPVIAAIVSDLKTATVTRGDSLWRISRRLLGHGMSYTQIYASNATQIRDPALIYPGQVFVMPAATPK